MVFGEEKTGSQTFGQNQRGNAVVRVKLGKPYDPRECLFAPAVINEQFDPFDFRVVDVVGNLGSKICSVR